MGTFDGLQDNMLDIVFDTMSYPATWTPVDGSPMQSAQVLLKEPTTQVKLEDEYDVDTPRIEYKPEDFTGLFDSVQRRNVETLVINGISYVTMRAEKKYDGKTIIIYLDKQ